MKRGVPAAVIIIMSIFIVSGCVNVNPESLAFASPLVKQFMDEYPNAKITATHFTKEQSARILENITAECGNPYINAREYYRITIDDPDSGMRVVAWIDWENREIECAVKYGKENEKTISKPGEGEKECASRYEARCHNGHVYWYDSCGNKESKKEYCHYGCENGECKETGSENCTDSDGGKNYFVKGTAMKGTQVLSDHCNEDGTLTEKYCDGNEIKWETILCPDGYECSGGRCVAAGAEEITPREEATLTGAGAEMYIKIDGVKHTLSLVGWDTACTTAYIQVDGQNPPVYGWMEGNSYETGVGRMVTEITDMSCGETIQVTLVARES